MRILRMILRGWIIFFYVLMGSFEPEKVGTFKPEMTLSLLAVELGTNLATIARRKLAGFQQVDIAVADFDRNTRLGFVTCIEELIESNINGEIMRHDLYNL